MQPLVSVVISFLNGEPFLAEAIESVRAQTYDRWELLLVDDGSTDGSTLLAHAYARQDPGRVRCLTHPHRANLGVSVSRNLGLAYARGRMIAFLDADDVWLPEKLARQVDLLRQHPEAAMTYGRFYRWYSWSGHSEEAKRDVISGLGVPPDSLVMPPALLRLHLQEKGIPGIGGLLVRREVIEAVGGFDEAFSMHEDQMFVAKVCAAYPVFVADDVWYRYRQHAASRCAEVVRAGEWEIAWLRYLDWLSAYLRARGPNDPLLRRILRTRLWIHRLRLLKRRLVPARLRPYLRRLRGILRRRASPASDLYAHERRG